MSGWRASAKKGATGQTYEIRTIADFLKVPEDRRRICLREFHAWLAMADSLPKLFKTAAETLGHPDPGVVVNLDVFAWMDDGKATITVNAPEVAAKFSDTEGGRP